MTKEPSKSSWERLRETAVAEGTTFSTTEIKPASLVGVYVCVWDSWTMLESIDDLDQEDNWIKLSIKNPTNLENASFADIEGRFNWWRQVGSFKGFTRAKGSKDNIWIVNGVTWSAQVDVDDDSDENPYSDDENGSGFTRAANDFGFASLCTLDSTGNPFFEMLYNTNKFKKPSSPEYVRTIWKKHKEGCRGPLVLSEREARRLYRDGAADFSETRDFKEEDKYAEDIEDEDEDEEESEDEDAEGDLDGELEHHDSSSLKRRAGEDERGPGAKRPKA